MKPVELKKQGFGSNRDRQVDEFSHYVAKITSFWSSFLGKFECKMLEFRVNNYLNCKFVNLPASVASKTLFFELYRFQKGLVQSFKFRKLLFQRKNNK